MHLHSSTRKAFAIALLALISSIAALASTASSKEAPPSRRAQLVEANIIAVYAYQIILARQAGSTASSACYSQTSPDTATLQDLVNHQKSLLAEPAAQITKWADSSPDSMPTTFDPAKDLEPLLHAKLTLAADLPVNVFTRYLEAAAPTQSHEKIRSVANLYQAVLEIERDGDVLQDLDRFYIALNLPVYVGQLGLQGSDADFLTAAQTLAGKSCASPYDLSVPAWQIAGRKIWNWGEKNLHIRDANVIATEMLAEPKVAALIPAMRSLPAEKIAVLGHSFTMDQHWASPSAFPPIVTAIFARENPRVEFRQWSAGGLRFERAWRNYYADALAWKPDIVLMVLGNTTPADMDAEKKMVDGFRASGARVLIFDDVELTSLDEKDPSRVQQVTALAKQQGAEIIPSRAALDAAPDRNVFPCMDGIHKTEPYHRLMATLWLKAILSQASPHQSATLALTSSAADSLSR